VALQDHFKWLKKEKQISEEPNAPALDLGFKEGETIKINMKITVSTYLFLTVLHTTLNLIVFKSKRYAN
jgi:hypothetical protein